ncbi:MAG: alpha/beta hydrolase [Chloroflexi bacterium]|nr:alpha/beta hydrolase [Chloroflexota bacterium]
MATRDWRDRRLQANGLRFHYQEWGSPKAPPMLLLHGFSQDGHSWDEFARALSGEYHIVALDQRGHGDSARAPDKDYSARAMLRDLEGIVRGLGWHRTPFTLCGLSMGGRNSMLLTAKHPRWVKGLVIVDVGPEVMQKGVENIRRFVTGADVLTLDEFVKQALKFNPRRSEENIRERLGWRLRPLRNGKYTWKLDPVLRDPDAPRPRLGRRQNLWKTIAKIACPTLVVRGGVSDVFAKDTGQKMAQVMAQARFVTVPRAGHSVMGDNPAGFEKAVRRFLKTVK